MFLLLASIIDSSKKANKQATKNNASIKRKALKERTKG
jgi:hypothetical protein